MFHVEHHSYKQNLKSNIYIHIKSEFNFEILIEFSIVFAIFKHKNYNFTYVSRGTL